MKDCFFVDNHILAVAKDFNVDVETYTGDIKNELAKLGLKNTYIEPINPISTEESGIVVFALTSKAKERLDAQIVEGDFVAKHFAICVGTPKERNNTNNGYVHMGSKTGRLEYIPQLNSDAQKIYDRYSVLEQNSQISFVCIEGGLVHKDEIRFVMADAGSPIFGDKLYGGDSLAKGTNTALSLVELKLIHPTTNKNLIFRYYPPIEKKPWSFFNVEKYLKI